MSTGCDDAGLCLYPAKGIVCATTCTYDEVIVSICDGAGGCSPGSPMPCPGNASCTTGTGCSGPCTTDGGCANGYFCDADAGTCVQ